MQDDLEAPDGDPRRRLHGHSYLLRLHLIAPLNQVLGWTVDYGDLKTLFKPVYERLDHHRLNDLPHLRDTDPASVALMDARGGGRTPAPARPYRSARNLRLRREPVLGESRTRAALMTPSTRPMPTDASIRQWSSRDPTTAVVPRGPDRRGPASRLEAAPHASQPRRGVGSSQSRQCTTRQIRMTL